ncbi:MAG: 3-hydroxyacyl-ACP dehydratase FabZ [Spirochaetaceae bacterium]|nr:3-hydroxyacyl-ACP dehydratase FabZ [Spirochaetaceae bacterium]MCF7948957.1 3-hydroxyacyl-ACP dehydratase FabZ [Spirochaetia bacterium]MCF7950964.1 3-hydroxyacyl-ACP dehydratase FabZ [Spirochaetaceae bacterium]
MSEIEKYLPHREPFLLVDSLESYDNERIVGKKLFSEQMVFFAGHFPGYPVVPGVLLIESMAQCGGAGVNAQGTLGEALFFLATVEKAKFRRQVKPNEEVRFEIENLRVTSRTLKQKGKAFVGEELAAEAEWLCLVDTSQPK